MDLGFNNENAGVNGLIDTGKLVDVGFREAREVDLDHAEADCPRDARGLNGWVDIQVLRYAGGFG